MAAKALFNSVVNWFIRQRMDQIKAFISHPEETQKGVLFSQLFQAENTEYGRTYGFRSISSVKDYKKQVPLVQYEDIVPWIERARKGEPDITWPGIIKHFAKSSGTTNARSKYIPISTECLEDCHYKAGKDLLALYTDNHPDNQLFQNKNLRLGGSSEMYKDYQTQFGDLSAILIDSLPFWVEVTTTPSKKVSLMSEWESKLKAIITEVTTQNVGSLSGVPSWMLVLLQKILAETGHGSIAELWPSLEVFFHGGISFRPYRTEYEKIIGKKINYYEIYNASEGFFAIQDQPDSDEMLLMLDYGIFYEFIPMENFYSADQPETVTLEEVEIGKNYALVISTNGGLWRYIIGDTIRFTSLDPYRIQVTGRTKHHINAFGEELMIDNVEDALDYACRQTGASVSEYTAAPVFMTEGSKGAHEWIIEFHRKPDSQEAFLSALDKRLREINSDYDAKRYKDITLMMPVLHTAEDNLFYKWMESRGKLGGQNKVPRLSNDREYLEPLLSLNEKLRES